MYKLNNLSSDSNTTFIDLLMRKWDELHENTNIFRYKIDKLEERVIEGKYLLQLNPNRRANRRIPEEINSIRQPFQENKFNFTKVSSEEILFRIEDNDSEIHLVLVNVSPISRYHSLLCPSVNKCLAQIVTPESLELAAEIMFLVQDRNLRIGFNSMCGFASVNHLHYHLFVEKNTLYVENVNWQHIKGNLHRLQENYPVPAFCFEIKRQSSAQTLKEVSKVLEYFLEKSIAHNILLTKRLRLGQEKDEVNVIIWPRKNTPGAKQLTAFNVAVLELSGWFPIYDAEAFKNLTTDDLEKELLKWNIEDFEKLCEEIKCL